MKRRCDPRFVKKTYSKARSWRKTAQELNALYDVNFSHVHWRAYSLGERDIADAATRAALGLGPRPCPTCGRKPEAVKLSRLLKRMTPKDLRNWKRLRAARKYKAANQFLLEVCDRKKSTTKGGETK
ncbi:MAG: hypothetical protein HONDAALG_02854 [Gammaproteobacteria bacterium]|nr:hypothetical protein [Gammaproteobacteria bacterium]